jgi:hypothetical protein
MTSPQRPLSFVDGVGVGLGAVSLLPLLAYILSSSDLARMYPDIGDLHLPLLTRIVLHPAWRIAVPAVVIGASIAVLVLRPRFRYATIATALLGILATGLSWFGAYLPLWQLAGSIQ